MDCLILQKIVLNLFSKFIPKNFSSHNALIFVFYNIMQADMQLLIYYIFTDRSKHILNISTHQC